ncbi:unnamed protein product [Rhizoctonia solani]|uniref:OV-16 antigen n=1 Tax=Rhizoctonia solani TaxID=456999 RepID=A0A8H3CWV0_9AGAM|nr:unnamed protein product [Rhizoctonia solani]
MIPLAFLPHPSNMRYTTLFATLALSGGLIVAAPAHARSLGKNVKHGRRPSLDQVKESFHKAHIVPDVLSEFEPSSLLYLTYTSDSLKHKDSEIVLPGKKFAKDATSSPPELSFEGPGWPGAFVFFLLDPDAPSRSDPKWSQVRHMFAGNLTIDGDSKHVPGSIVLASSSSPVNDYMPPAPPPGSGFHRYVALLYAQPPDFDYSFLNTSDRFGFNITEFSQKSGLGTPLAGTFLKVKVKDDDDVYWLPVIKYIWSYWRQVTLKILF